MMNDIFKANNERNIMEVLEKKSEAFTHMEKKNLKKKKKKKIKIKHMCSLLKKNNNKI